jgi:hypothetical protein
MSYIVFQEDDSVVSSDSITAGLWTNNVYNLTTAFTSSVQQTGTSGKYYLNVYNLAVGSSGSEVQYAVAYGHVSGSGSALFNSLVNEKSPTRDIYGQYRNLVYGDESTVFNFGSSANVGSSCAPISVNTAGNSRDIFAISVNRSRYKEKINTGTWNLILNNGGTAIQLTDNSKDSSTTNFIGGNRFYYIVSGSNGNSYNATAVQTASGSYGLFFPDMGVFILNPRALALSSANGGVGMTVDETPASTYSAAYNINNDRLYRLISAGVSFQANSQETISARYFFVNAKSSQLNYTTNPSVIDNNGNILYATLIDNPQVFPTTIGLYNDSNELLAVAKLSKPLPKDFTKQITCRVKLEF